MKWMYLLMSIVGGIAIGIQAIVNGGLGKKVGTIEASFISFLIGTIALFITMLFFGKGNFFAFNDVPKWQLIGGLLGAFYVFIMVMTVPKIGVTAAFFSIIAGQILIAVIIDHFGLFGGQTYPLNIRKALAILLMFGSMYLFNQK
ncbi:DMT family transporter [Paenisporosarcina antarctica]|uniref:DMT family transporter n=1 Tax=Paenisporosarcina antarctica TaxID=417367 RepID=A0A4P6ZZN0_9BACL|nr:DMT family transporter [Paenisporosarcina antarctica]QBP41947.1 DMT family transporter [Paenisporosarcina antarctica]